MTLLPLLLGTGAIVGLVIVAFALLVIIMLLRASERCPKDGAAMKLRAPERGAHMVFKCPKCGHIKKTQIARRQRR